MLVPSDSCRGKIVCSVEEDPQTKSKIYVLSTKASALHDQDSPARIWFPEFSFLSGFEYLTQELMLPQFPGMVFRFSPFVPREESFQGVIKLVQGTPDAYKTLIDGNPWSDRFILNTFLRYYKGVGATLQALKKAAQTFSDFPWTPDFDMCYVIYARDPEGAETFAGRFGFLTEKELWPHGTQVYYALLPQFWASGLGTHIGLFLKQQWDHIFNTSGRGYLRGLVQSGRNPASAKILESMGMKAKFDSHKNPLQVCVSEWNNALYSVWEYPRLGGRHNRAEAQLKREERIRNCANKETGFKSLAGRNGG